MFSEIRDWCLRQYVRSPEHPAKYRIVRWLGRHMFPERGIAARVHGNVRLYLHPRDWIEYLLLRGEAYEPATLDFLAANLAPGQAAMLAGVNFGQHVLVAARAVGSTGRVFGVEPQPAACLRTRDNIQLNGAAPHVTIVQAALGASDDFVPMVWSSPDNAGAANLFDAGTGFVVALTSVKALLHRLKAAPLRLMLVDVEGYEQHVLAGMDPERLPEILVVEVEPTFMARAGSDVAGLLDRVRGLGYATFDLFGRQVTGDGDNLAEKNLIAVRPGVTVRWSTQQSRRSVASAEV